MATWFFACLGGLLATTPPYFLSVEHKKLQKRYGKEKGTKIGKALGVISGWGFFFFWFGIWISPQPRFVIAAAQKFPVSVPVLDWSIPLVHLVVFVPLFVLGGWFGIKGTQETSLKVAETHKPERIVTTGVYAIVRHPQYLGGLLAHIGVSFLLSALYSLLLTPLVATLVYILSRKEEKELIREFGKEYERYRRRVPMFLPRLRRT